MLTLKVLFPWITFSERGGVSGPLLVRGSSGVMMEILWRAGGEARANAHLACNAKLMKNEKCKAHMYSATIT